jgi:hypothetical protein
VKRRKIVSSEVAPMYAAKVGYPRTSGAAGGALREILSSICEDMLML